MIHFAVDKEQVGKNNIIDIMRWRIFRLKPNPPKKINPRSGKFEPNPVG